MSDDRFVMAFYGAEPPSDSVERFFYLVVDWFTEMGFPPDRLGVSGRGFSTKKGTFRRGVKKLQSFGFSTVQHFEFDKLMPDNISGARHFTSAGFSRDADRYAILSVPSSFCAVKETWLPMARQVVELLQPAYGIGFERRLIKGPVFYAMGINFCQAGEPIPIGDEDERCRSISRWSDIGMEKEVYREGLLRYVYRWNFLTQPQLDRKVEETSLAGWIQAGQERGTLAPFCGGVWLWEVAEDQLEPIRDRLHEAGAIFDWRKYCKVEPGVKTILG